MTANRTPSLIAATAAPVASRAARILAPPIEPEVSMTMTSTLPPPDASPAPSVPAVPPPARYSFWKHSRWKSGMSLLLGLGLGRLRAGVCGGLGRLRSGLDGGSLRRHAGGGLRRCLDGCLARQRFFAGGSRNPLGS